jgi:hypothetical protein
MGLWERKVAESLWTQPPLDSRRRDGQIYSSTVQAVTIPNMPSGYGKSRFLRPGIDSEERARPLEVDAGLGYLQRLEHSHSGLLG